MSGDAETPVRRRGRRALLLAYCLFVVYGSLFPFEFSFDQAVLERSWSRAVIRPFDATGRRRFSLPDVVSNVMLGVPVGMLVARPARVRSRVPRPALAAGMGLLFASAVEVAQMFCPSRTVSGIDVAAQTLGALLGALAAGVGARVAMTPEARLAAREITRRPALVVALILVGVIVADALYPYAVTLDVSTAWGNLKRARLVPLTGLSGGFWGDLLVEKLLPYGVLALALRLGLGSFRTATGLNVWLLVTAFAACLEVAKLGIVGRSPSTDNLLVESAGALAGVAAAPLAGRGWVHRHGAHALVAVAAALIVYEELTPFDFTASVSDIARKAGRIEWLPMGAYYGADARSALFDLGKKLVLGGFLGVALRLAGRRRPWTWALTIALVVEGLQIAQRSHVPAVTDVASLTAGAALGVVLLERYRPGRVSNAGH